jgi:protein SCO1/2
MMTELNNTLNPADSPRPPQTPAQSAPARHSRTRPIIWAGAFLVVLVLAAVAGWWYFVPPTLHGMPLQSPRVADDFTLTSTTGKQMSLSDFRGKYVVLFFGYTYCPDVCPTTLSDIQQMLKELGAKRAEDVQVLMVTVDPERDTAQQLATYLHYFDPSFIGMTGDVADIQPVAKQFGIFFEKEDSTDKANYVVDHTAVVTIIDPKGYVREIFNYGVSGADMASDVAYLMRRG